MITPSRAIIGVLTAMVVGLSVALALVLASDDDGTDNHMVGQGQGFAGMMSAMADMDSDSMLEYMKEVLGEDGFQQMVQHFQDHSGGASMTGMSDVDQMMHTMMDGIFAEMPSDSHHILPQSNPDGQTATATTSPTPTR